MTDPSSTRDKSAEEVADDTSPHDANAEGRQTIDRASERSYSTATTVTFTVAMISGPSLIATSCIPRSLIGSGSTIFFRSTSTPLRPSAAAMSLLPIDPKSLPFSPACAAISTLT